MVRILNSKIDDRIFSIDSTPKTMLLNYILTAWRTLKNDKLFSLINIMGLTIGLAASIAIFQYVKFEYSYDDFHEGGEHIYRVTNWIETPGGYVHYQTESYPAMAAELTAAIPGIESYLRVDYRLFESGTLLFYDQKGSPQHIAGARGIVADSNFFSFFTFPLIEGNAEKVLRKPGAILISESIAKEWFPNENPVGKVLSYQDYSEANQDVTIMIEGVFADIPSNSHLDFDYVLSNLDAAGKSPSHWDSSTFFQTYLKLKPATDVSMFEEKTKPFISDYLDLIREKWEAELEGWHGKLILQPLSDIHLMNNFKNELKPRQNPLYLNMLALIGLLVLIIAAANYVNLSTAKALKRHKEVGIRKVVGARRWQLVGQFMLESFFLVGVAFILANTSLEIGSSLFEELKTWKEAMMMGRQLEFLPYLLGIFLLTGFLAGIYPALILARFQPEMILKTHKAVFFQGLNLRRTLVLLQFTMTIALVIAGFGIYRQLMYLQNQELGFHSEQLLVIYAPKISGDPSRGYDRFETEVKNLAGVQGIAASQGIPGGLEQGNISFSRYEAEEEKRAGSYSNGGVSYDFVEVFQIPLLYGRNFSRDRATDSSAVIVSERVTRDLGYSTPAEALGAIWMDREKEAHVIGIIKDYELGSFHLIEGRQALNHRGLALALREGQIGWMHNYRYFTLRVTPQSLPELLPQLGKTYRSLFPDQHFNYFFLDDRFASFYRSEGSLVSSLWG